MLLEHSQRQTHALKEQVQQRQARQRDYELQRADAEKLRQQMADTLRWRRAITLVAQALPEQVWLTRMTMREQHLHIEGHTHSAAYLTELEQRLRRSPPLRFIRLKRVELLAEERVWRFQIALEADRDDEESL
ncbi:PilN domain-containing protein [Apirhabdus apintestini]|nr:PilN domain-containing protein [Enterobacteriaceae bacterium CA-0114]